VSVWGRGKQTSSSTLVGLLFISLLLKPGFLTGLLRMTVLWVGFFFSDVVDDIRMLGLLPKAFAGPALHNGVNTTVVGSLYLCELGKEDSKEGIDKQERQQ